MRLLVPVLLSLLGIISHTHSQGCEGPCDVYIVLTGSDTMVEVPSLMEGARNGLANFFAALKLQNCDTRVSVCTYGTTAVEQIIPNGALNAGLIVMVGGISRLDLGIECARISSQANRGLRPGVCQCMALIVYEDPLGFGGSDFTNASRAQVAMARNEGFCRITLTTFGENVYANLIQDFADIGYWLDITGDFTNFQARTKPFEDILWNQLQCCPEVLTTPQPTRPPMPGVCNDCIIIQGIGYKHVDGECRQFIQCFFNGSDPPFMVKWTSLGTFWDTPQVEQRIPKDIVCQWDPCMMAGRALRGWPDDRNCAGYWACGDIDGTWRTLEWVCCDMGDIWDNVAMQCVNGVCDTPCPVGLPTTSPFQCPMDVRADPRFFFDTRDLDADDRSCAEGMEFSLVSCTCIGNPVEDPCEPILHVTFDDGQIRDTSINNFWIANVGGVVAQTDDGINWYGVFNGNAHIFVPGTANMDLRNDWAFVVDYDGQNSPNNYRVALIGNRDCAKPEGAFYLALTNPSTVEGFVRTRMGVGTASVSAPASGLNHAVYEYRAETGLTVSVGVASSNNPVKGLMWRDNSLCSIHIGWGQGLGNFTGRIYEVIAYRDPDCIPDIL